MSREEIDALLNRSDIAGVISKRVALKKKGPELVGICPFHQDTKESLQVSQQKQIYKCFACGKAGDSIDFIMSMGGTFQEAINELSGGSASASSPNENRAVFKPQKKIVWKQLAKIQGAPDFKHYRHGEPSDFWTYHDKSGEILGHICRFDTTEGKEVIPIIFATDGKRSEWRWQGFASPRPLYNLHLIASKPEATIFLVEGEKTASAAAELFPKAIITTWIGGARAIKQTDFSPLKGRNVYAWPDNDEPGFSAMSEIKQLSGAKSFKFVLPPQDSPTHWDIADADWTEPDARAYFVDNITEAIKWEEKKEEPEPEALPIPKLPTEAPDPEDQVPFICLGYEKAEDKQMFCFFVKESKTVVKFSAGNMGMSQLITLAPINYWEDNYPASKSAKFDSLAVMNHLVRKCNAKGIFDEDMIRGRGAWMEGSRSVLHAGTHIVTDNKIFRLGEYKSPYIYELGKPLGFKAHKELDTKSANKLIQILELINWERDINAYLLAGWCVIATVCGALKWRPHIWITGGAGTGKSWLFKNIVRALLGKTCLAVQGETSEAGIRQTLKHDALPVVFDEAEGEDEKSRTRMDTILSLMRAASADDGGIMAKGTAGGASKTFRIRSCFAFASIGIGVKHQSDRSRVTILGIVDPADKEYKDKRWRELSNIYAKTIDENFIDGLHARTIKLLPVILQNAVTFSNAAAAEIGMQRAGDQLGALLAGAYSLFSTNIISYEDAVKWIKKKDWDEERGLDKTKDEHACFAYIMDQITRVDGLSGAPLERNIGELVSLAAEHTYDDFITKDRAHQRLRRLGIKINGDFIAISNTSDWVVKCLTRTAWPKNHNKILLRLKGARSEESTTFSSGIKSRAVLIPLNYLFQSENP